MCFRALLYAVFHSIRIGFEDSKLKIVDQKASDGRVSQIGFQFLRWLEVRAQDGTAAVQRDGQWAPAVDVASLEGQRRIAGEGPGM